MPVSLVATDYSRPAQELLAQPPQHGTVHGIFRRAVNIALDGTMLTLLSDELPRMPNGVRLLAARYHAEMRALAPGMAVRAGNGTVSIPACGFTLHLPTAPAWEPRPDVINLQWSRRAVAQQRRWLTRYLAARAGQEGLAPLLRPSLYETPLTRLARPALRALMQAAWRQDSAGIAGAAHGLAGLGPGLTPSGDDALAGFAAVMALLGPQLSADAAPRDHIARIIAATAGPRTTRLSATLLNHAARGEVAESLGNLLLALALPEPCGPAQGPHRPAIFTDRFLGKCMGQHKAPTAPQAPPLAPTVVRVGVDRTTVGAGLVPAQVTVPHPKILPVPCSDLLQAADALLACGATSGADTLLGVLAGLQTLEGEVEDDFYRQ